MKFNEQVTRIEPSPLRAFNDMAHKEGAELFLTLGEPDFHTPQQVKDACGVALENNKTFYAPTMGVAELRREISAFEKQLNGVDYDENEIMVTTGSTEAIMSALFAVVNEGDEVIVPVPAFSMYKPVIELCKGRYVELNTAPDNFQITEKALASVVSDKTKAIILTSPNNPTGTILDEKSLLNVYEQVKKRDMFVICDECYNQLVYNERRPGFVRFQDLREKIVYCQSFSKPYAMTGWRLGYMMASKEFIEQAFKVHQYTTVCANTFIQYAAIEALRFDPAPFVEEYRKRRDYCYDRLVAMGLDVVKPEGAFYIMPNISKFGMSSMEFCTRLVKECKVAVIPGVCFSAEGYMRIGYCVSMDTIVKALDRLEKFVAGLEKKCA